MNNYDEDFLKCFNECYPFEKYIFKEQKSIGMTFDDMIIFPELKENEDERIRMSLIELFNDMEWGDSILHDYNMDKDKTIAWLEKQGEKAQSEEIKGNEGEISSNWTEEDSLMIDSIIDTIKWLEGKGATNMKIKWMKSLKQRMGE